MIRRNHILTTAALMAVFAVPASAATYEDLHATGGTATSGDLMPPPSSIAASAADEYEQLRTPGAQALNRDYGSPDAADAARGVPADGGQYALDRDFGSPDAADAARAVPADGGQYALDRDFGSPDAADAARDLPPVSIPTPVVEVRGTPAGGFDWGDAGIGAAGMLGLFSIAAGSALLLTGRRRRQGVSVATH
jgi:hypothetical protein